MAESILKLRVDSTEYNSKLQRASQGLQQYADQCRKAGGTLESVEKDTLDFVKALGQMETTSKTVRGSLGEMTKVFTEMKMQYKQLTDAEKSAPYGKALAQSLDQLKGRINQAQSDLKSINQELQGGSGKFGQFGSVIDGLGQKMGVNANLTELLTSKTALMTGAIGASATAVIAATNAWSEYNSEIAKQQQITTVTTGLKGDDADKMTSAARALSKTYGVDFREAINAANTMMTQFGKSGDESIQLLRDGMQGMIMGDGPKLLSMIQQYAPAFRDAGVSASQLVAVIQNSEGGIFTAENMNAIVIGIKNIRLMTKQTGDALAQIGIDGKEVTKALNDGTMTIFDALKLVAGQLKDVDSNSQAAGQVMQAVFGRQGAMAGTNLAKAIEGLNTNLAETKLQTGEVGRAYDELYQANVRLEQALQKTFGYKGWEEMSVGIKTKLVSAMANVLELTNKINAAFNNTFAVSFFEGIYNASTRALGPLGTILRLLKDINKEKGGATGGGTGNTKNENFEYIKGGATKQEREDRYSKVLSDINKNLAEIGKEKTRTNKDGSTSFYIDSPAEQQRQRQQLLDQRTQLVMNRDTLMAGNPSKTSYTFEPFTPSTTTNKKGSHTATNPKQAERDRIMSQWLNAQAKTIHDITLYDGQVMTLAEAEKAAEKTAREQEQAQKKLADAQKKRTELEESWKTPSMESMSTLMQDLKKRQGITAVGSADFNGLQNNIIDLNTLQSLINMQLKNGLNIDPDVTKNLMSQIVNGINIPDEKWQELQDEINEKLAEFNIAPINIDLKTGNLKALNKDANETVKGFQQAAQAIGSVSSALNGLEDPGAKIMGIVGQAIAQIALGFSQATTASSTGGIFAWIAAIAGGMATMISTIGAIHSATGYANGGIVDGRGGGLVTGTTYSSDQIPIMANAGEVVLNASQQSMLANNLQNNGGGKMEIVGVLTGENVVLMADRWGRRTGKGELLFGKNL